MLARMESFDEVSGINLPPGPADTVYPTSVLARVMFAQAAADLAERAAKLVDVDDGKGVYSRCDAIVHAANHLRELAAIHDYERKGFRPEDPRHQTAIREWQFNIERPFEKMQNGWARPAVPKGVLNPKETAEQLDTWAQKHGTCQYSNAISVSLAEHTTESEQESLYRHEAFLQTVTDPSHREIQAHKARALRVRTGNTSGTLLSSYDEVPTKDDPHGLAKPLWSRIIRNVIDRAPAIAETVEDAECLRDGGQMIVIGHPTAEGARVLSAITGTFLLAYGEVTGTSGPQVRVAAPGVRERIKEEQQTS